MTTIACNGREIAADTRVSWDGVNGDVFTAVKLFASKKAVYGVTGEDCTGSLIALEWLLSERNPEHKPQPPHFEHGWNWKLIELTRAGIAVYNEYLERDVIVERCAAAGSGAKVALYCMRYLKMCPAEAVREACKIDHHSEAPIYVASLDSLKIERWRPGRKGARRGR